MEAVAFARKVAEVGGVADLGPVADAVAAVLRTTGRADIVARGVAGQRSGVETVA